MRLHESLLEILHLLTFQVSCSFGCNMTTIRRDVQQHEEKCEHRPRRCEYCNQNLKMLDFPVIYCCLIIHFQEHLKVCNEFEIECKECKKMMTRSKIKAHLDKECPEVMVPCSFAAIGCTAKVFK